MTMAGQWNTYVYSTINKCRQPGHNRIVMPHDAIACWPLVTAVIKLFGNHEHIAGMVRK